MGRDVSWEDARRIESWVGEVRVNLIRLAALVLFYGHHLVNVYLLRDRPEAAGTYHVVITLLVLIWVAEVLILHVCLTRRWLPPALKFVATGWDLVLVTTLLAVGSVHAVTDWPLEGDPQAAALHAARARDAAASLLPVLYFLVIGAAALRLDLALVYVATLGAMAGYLFWLGLLRFGLQLPDEQRLPRPQQIIFLLALGGAGVIAGQMVRQARRLTQGYPVRVAETEGK